MYLEIKNLSKKYGYSYAVKDISFGLEEGKFLCLLGPSGSGENSIMVTDTIIKLNQGLKASTKFLNKMILI